MGIGDKALAILLGVLLLAALIFLGEQEFSLRHALSTTNRSLNAEIQCRVGSTCAAKLQAEADRGAALVDEARAATSAAAAAQKASLDKQAMDAVRGLQDAAQRAASDALAWKQKYSQALQTPECEIWAKQIRACAIPP